MPLNLTYTKIRRLCDDLYFERGRAYYQQGRVVSLEVEREEDTLIVFRAQAIPTTAAVTISPITSSRRTAPSFT
ncbi:hypothetical protein [Methylomarinovum tepidoasis]|uniref:hypothetical protein n=1 Tax=Methylomarinovum tepidoasis TaxID=2840183 RepID=UPI002574281E|nr:hypothetical protein [Methylomarinovum sp. IN45]